MKLHTAESENAFNLIGVIEGSLDRLGRILIVRVEKSGQRVLVGLHENLGLPFFIDQSPVPVAFEKPNVETQIPVGDFLEAFEEHRAAKREDAVETAEDLVKSAYRNRPNRAILVEFPEGRRVLVGELYSSDSLNRGRTYDNYVFRLITVDDQHFVVSYEQLLAFTQYKIDEQSSSSPSPLVLKDIAERNYWNN